MFEQPEPEQPEGEDEEPVVFESIYTKLLQNPEKLKSLFLRGCALQD